MKKNAFFVRKKLKYSFLIGFILINVVIFSEALTPASQSTETSMSFTNLFAAFANFFGTNVAKVIEPQSVSISGFETIVIGESKRLIATVLPDTTTDKAITWSSSNEEVAEVTSGGIVVAYDFGFTSITATSSNSLICSSANIEVVDYPLPTSFDISLSAESIFVGTTSIVSVSNIEPSKALSTSISFSSSDGNVAQVNEFGVIKGVGAGTTTITAYSQSYSQFVEITVVLSPDPIVQPYSLTIVGDNQGYVGRSTQLYADFGSIIPTDQTVTWLSNNLLVASVDNAGLVFGTKIPGSAIITVFCNADEAVRDTFEILISNVLPSTLTLFSPILSVVAGKTIDIMPTFNPIDTTNKEIIWSSSNETVAKVSSFGDYGKVVGLKLGTTKIAAVSVLDSRVTAMITIEVLKPNTLDAHDRALLNSFLRKAIGHFALFFFDGLFGYFTFFLLFKKNDWQVLVISGGIGIAVGALSEVCQLFTEGRSGKISDALIDSAGYLLAIFILFFILRAINRRKSLKNNSKVA